MNLLDEIAVLNQKLDSQLETWQQMKEQYSKLSATEQHLADDAYQETVRKARLVREQRESLRSPAENAQATADFTRVIRIRRLMDRQAGRAVDLAAPTPRVTEKFIRDGGYTRKPRPAREIDTHAGENDDQRLDRMRQNHDVLKRKIRRST